MAPRSIRTRWFIIREPFVKKETSYLHKRCQQRLLGGSQAQINLVVEHLQVSVEERYGVLAVELELVVQSPRNITDQSEMKHLLLDDACENNQCTPGHANRICSPSIAYRAFVP